MSALRELARVLRCTQTAISVRWCAWDLDRARTRLAQAMHSHDQAIADYRAHHPGHIPQAIPEYLRRVK